MQNNNRNNRKRFHSNRESENPIPPKLPNKRTVFEDVNDYQAELPEKPHNPSFMVREFGLKSVFWRHIQIRGPFLLTSSLTPQVITNRALYHLIREISEQLHRNFENYQQNELAVLIRTHQSMKVEEVIDCLKAMSERTMKYERGSFRVTFFTENLLQTFRNLLMGAKPPIRLVFDDFPVLLEQLRSICQERNVPASESELLASRNSLTRFLSHVQSDFVICLPIHEDRALQNLDVIRSDVYKLRSDITRLIMLSSLPKLSIGDLTSKNASFWIVISCSGRAQLLEHVFAYGLLEWLPWNVKEFLTGWMEKVQKRMRRRWINGDLKKVVDALLDSDEKQVALNSPVIENFLKKMCDNVLNCNDDFKVFDEKWMEAAGEVLQSLIHTNYLGNRKWELNGLLDSPEFAHLASLFPRSEVTLHLLRHVKTHLFHFFLKFCFHSLRFVFQFNFHSRTLSHNGKLEFDEVPDFKKIDKEEALLTPPTIVQQQVTWPRKTLLPTPLLNQNHNAPICSPVFQPPAKISFMAIHPSAASTQPPIKNEPMLCSEVTEEELKSARALRPPSEASLLQLEEDEDVPKKWRDAYSLLLEWNADLKKELDSVKERYDKFC